MKHTSTSHKLGRVVAALFGLALVLGLFWGSDLELSWAAPEQHPDQQTVPHRPPTPRPTPPPEPPTQLPGDQDSDDDDDQAPAPVQSPEPDDGADGQVPGSVGPPELGQGTDDGTSPPVQPPDQEGDATDETAPVQPFEEETEEDSVPVTLQQADLSLSKVLDNPTPKLGEPITFTIVVSNSGPSIATAVAVSDPRPTGLLRLSSATPSQGSFNSDTGLWAVGAIIPGQSVTLSVAATVARAGAVTNTAEIIAADQFDPDSTPGNFLESEDDQDSAPLVASLESSATIPPDNNKRVTFPSTAAPASEALVLSGGARLLYWLYALVLGVILLLTGLFLVRRA